MYAKYKKYGNSLDFFVFLAFKKYFYAFVNKNQIRMFKQLLICICVLFFVSEANAQYKIISRNKIKVSEASVYGNFGLYDQPSWGLGASVQYLWGVGRGNQRFKLGMGLREYTMFSKRREYETSSQDFVKYLLNGTDSVYFEKLNANLLNVYVAMLYNIKRGVDFGINIDLGGITFGGTKEAYFHSYELTQAEKYKVFVKPYAFNFNTGMGKGNIGNIYSEAYFSFRASQVTRFRAGLNFMVSEIKTSYPITGNGVRFRTQNYFMSLGVAVNIRDGAKDEWFR